MLSFDTILEETAAAYREVKTTDHFPLALSTLLKRAIQAHERFQNTPVANDAEVEILALGRRFMVGMWAQFAGIDSERAEAQFMFEAYGYAG